MSYLTLINEIGFYLNIYKELKGYYLIPKQTTPGKLSNPNVLKQSCPE